jgi:very-short-patch-repair endonuclease
VNSQHKTNPEQRDFARALRSRLTEAEQALWQRLRRQQLQGERFRRQVPLGPYVADFVCFEQRLVIELDGGQHADSTKDSVRDAWLLSQGFRVLRFWNNDVLRNMEGVLQVTLHALQTPPPQPSPVKGEGAISLSPLTGEGWDGGGR